MTKEELVWLFGGLWLDTDVELFNMLLNEYKKTGNIPLLPYARGGGRSNKVIDCFVLYTCYLEKEIEE